MTITWETFLSTKRILIILDREFPFLTNILDIKLNKFFNSMDEEEKQKEEINFEFYFIYFPSQENNIYLTPENEAIHNKILNLYSRFKEETKECLDALPPNTEDYKQQMTLFLKSLDIDYYNFVIHFGGNYRVLLSNDMLSELDYKKKLHLLEQLNTLSFFNINKNIKISSITLIKKFNINEYKKIENWSKNKFDLIIGNYSIQERKLYEKDIKTLLYEFIDQDLENQDYNQDYKLSEKELVLYFEFEFALTTYLDTFGDVNINNIIKIYNDIFCALPNFAPQTDFNLIKVHLYKIRQFIKKFVIIT